MSLAQVVGTSLSSVANATWGAVKWINQTLPAGSFHPQWAPAPSIKSDERTFPVLGFPRETDSLCPRCVKEVRDEILAGRKDWRSLVEENPGEIKARIVERDGEVWMEKTCDKHGDFEDQMAMDVDFLRKIESLYPGRDYRIVKDDLHDHGTSSIRYGRGAVLTVDLTNRCNMMCEPCFMDANQVGYVHELTWDDIKKILDDAVSIKPKRQLSVQFSGGEPTMSPFFMQAVAYARKLGFFSIQAATNGIKFAQDIEFARQAADAGMRLAYLQFDGVTNEANSHRKVGNLFDVKLRAIENLHAAGIDVTLVTTIVNGVNNEQVVPIIRFAAENIDKINAISFQPVSFTGRDEDITDEDRASQRYTLSHMAHEIHDEMGITEPLRDWFPLSASGPLSDLIDQLNGSQAEWGNLKCGCHPNCGIGTMLLVNEDTKEIVPLCDVLDVEQFLEDLKAINDAARPKSATVAQVALSLFRNFKADSAPEGLGLVDMLRIFDGHTGRRMGLSKVPRYRWRMLLVAGMWFQDLFNYDFRRTEMCIIPYGTQLGEVSFCAYNTGIGWRQIVEDVFQTASTIEWFKTKGRHQIFAAGKEVGLPERDNLTVKVPEMVELPVVSNSSDSGGGCGSGGCSS
ncbi:MAG: radical SAM protein [Acidobacteriota bacterium]